MRPLEIARWNEPILDRDMDLDLDLDLDLNEEKTFEDIAVMDSTACVSSLLRDEWNAWNGINK
jgi:hypothetical protein